MSDGNKYFCFCSSNCKYETMTKEQILAAIAQAAESGMVYDADAAVISKVKESNAGGSLTFWLGTQAQYNAIATKDANCFYIITDSTKDKDIADAVAAANAKAEEAFKLANGKTNIAYAAYTYFGDDELREILEAELKTMADNSVRIIVLEGNSNTFDYYPLRATIFKGSMENGAYRYGTVNFEQFTYDGVQKWQQAFSDYGSGGSTWTWDELRKLSDYVIEQGTSGIWTYRKWASGIAECWGTNSINTAISTAWGTMYTGTTTPLVNYPFTFAAVPVEQVTVHTGRYACWLFGEASDAGGRNTTARTGAYNVARPTVVTEVKPLYFEYYVVGRWK